LENIHSTLDFQGGYFSFYFFIYFFFLVSNPCTFVLYIIGQPPLLLSTFHGFCRLTFPLVIANASSIFPFVALHGILLACILPALKSAGKKAYVLVLL
jgi:hypothetical protein